MAKIFENRNIRSVRIFADHAVYDGVLNLGLLGRTLDELNAPNRAFLSLSSPAVVSGDVDMAGNPLVVGKGSILFVIELSPPEIEGRVSTHVPRAQYQRLAVRLRIQGFQIDGYIHASEQVDLLTRLNLSRHFIALTSVSIVGPGLQIKAPFLAANLPHIACAQTAFRLDVVPEKQPEHASTAGKPTSSV